jgi:hypothetical protein
MDQDILYIHSGSYLGENKVVDMGLPIYEQYCKIKKKPFCLKQTLKERKKRKILDWVHPSQVLRCPICIFIYLISKCFKTIDCMCSNYGNLVANTPWKFTCRLFCSNVSIISTSSHSKFNFGKLDSSYPRIANVMSHKLLSLEL